MFKKIFSKGNTPAGSPNHSPKPGSKRSSMNSDTVTKQKKKKKIFNF